jgi:hypothetical protein
MLFTWESKSRNLSKEKKLNIIASLFESESKKIDDYFSDKKQEEKSKPPIKPEQLLSQVSPEKKVDVTSMRFLIEAQRLKNYRDKEYELSEHPCYESNELEKKEQSSYKKRKNEINDTSLWKDFSSWNDAVMTQSNGMFIKQLSLIAQKVYYDIPGPNYLYTIFFRSLHSIRFFIENDFALFLQAFGFALGGHRAEASHLLKKLINNHPNLIGIIGTEMNLCMELGENQQERLEYLELRSKPVPDASVIYQAVKEKNKEKLIKALLVKITTSRPDVPIVLLAMERDVESLDFLIKSNVVLLLLAFFCALDGQEIEAYEFLEYLKRIHPNEASMIHREMIKSFVYNNHLTLAEDLLEQFKQLYPHQISIALQDQAFCAALAGNPKKTYEFLEQLKNISSDYTKIIKDIAFGFALARHRPYGFEVAKPQASLLYDLLERVSIQYPKELESVFNSIIRGKQLNREKIDEFVTKAWQSIKDPTLRDNLYGKLQNSIKEIKSFLKKAEVQRQALMTKEGIDYPQSWAWIQPEVQIFLLNSISLANQKKFYHPILLLHIAEFLIPLSAPDICDLSNKFFMKIGSKRFFKNLLADKEELLEHEYISLLKEEKSCSDPFLKQNEFVTPINLFKMDCFEEKNTFIISISSDSKYKNYNHPIISVAFKNDKKSVESLLKTQHSLIAFAAFGYAKGGHQEEAYALLKEDILVFSEKRLTKYYDSIIGNMVHKIASGFVAGGFTEKAYLFLEKIKNGNIEIRNSVSAMTFFEEGMAFGFGLSMKREAGNQFLKQKILEHKNDSDFSMLNKTIREMAIGFSLNGCKQEAYKLLEKTSEKGSLSDIKDTLALIAEAENAIGGCIDKAIVIKMYLIYHLASSFYDSSDHRLKRSITKYDMEEIYKKIKILSDFMKAQDINYHQLKGWLDPAVQKLIIQKDKLDKNKMKESSSSFLNTATTSESSDLLNKMTMEAYRVGFFKHSQARNLLLINSFRKPSEDPQRDLSDQGTLRLT